MTNEDQVAALFAKANPVPSLDLLDPIEQLDMHRLEDQSERSSKMTDVETVQHKKKERQPRARLLLGFAMAVIAVAAVGILVSREGGVASPESIASDFIVASNAHDMNAITDLMAPDVDLVDLGIDEAVWAQDEAMGWGLTAQSCEAESNVNDPAQVVCSALLETDMSRALGLEPGIGTITVFINEGKVESASWVVDDPRGAGEAWDIFRTWMEENHPDDVATMYDPGGGVYATPESVAFWEAYTDEFAASHGG